MCFLENTSPLFIGCVKFTLRTQLMGRPLTEQVTKKTICSQKASQETCHLLNNNDNIASFGTKPYDKYMLRNKHT